MYDGERLWVIRRSGFFRISPRGIIFKLLSTSSLLRRILIVDDSWAWRRAVRSLLQKHLDLVIIGECSDGLEAVQKSEELRPDLVLLDIGLPNLNGVEAARQIRKVAPVSRILFLTNHGPGILHEAMSAGALGLVVKLKASREFCPPSELSCATSSSSVQDFDLLHPTKPVTAKVLP